MGRGEAGASRLDLPTRMKGAIDILDVVALTEDLPEHGLYGGKSARSWSLLPASDAGCRNSRID